MLILIFIILWRAQPETTPLTFPSHYNKSERGQINQWRAMITYTLKEYSI